MTTTSLFSLSESTAPHRRSRLVLPETLTISNEDGSAAPWLAESWTHTDDFRQWDITVRPGIKFHNGRVLDAEIVKKNLEAYYRDGLISVSLRTQFERVEVVGVGNTSPKPWWSGVWIVQ